MLLIRNPDLEAHGQVVRDLAGVKDRDDEGLELDNAGMRAGVQDDLLEASLLLADEKPPGRPAARRQQEEHAEDDQEPFHEVKPSPRVEPRRDLVRRLYDDVRKINVKKRLSRHL
jgi:hypothetical protein